MIRKVLALGLAGLMINPAMFAAASPSADSFRTKMPIKHLVVIFQENVSFDHYFGTYPVATNPVGEPAFTAKADTPAVNGLTFELLNDNPNLLNTANNSTTANSVVSNPFRLDHSEAATADQDHNYMPEQLAFDKGLMDLFPLSVGTADTAPEGAPPAAPVVNTKALTMGYFDGNTVTAMWNYAQYYSMSDNSWDTNFGPSTPGALNVISGQTNGVINAEGGPSTVSGGLDGSTTLVGDSDPLNDICSTASTHIQMSGKNIGDLLNEANVTWGFFSGGFNLNIVNANGTTGCKRTTTSAVTGETETDYIPHHQPFQYYVSTQNLAHTRPASISEIGKAGPANHQYDVQDFFAAVSAGNFPAVSYLKAPGYQDGHAGYSDPLDEQNFIVTTINFLEKQPDWDSTAVIIAYDDSDGWYDHQMSPLVNQSNTTSDALTGTDACGNGLFALPGVGTGSASDHVQGRCGYGPRLPFLVISPWARKNYVDHSIIDQSSVVAFIEDNWLSSERIGGGSFDSIAGTIENMFDFTRSICRQDMLILSPTTGEVTSYREF